MKIEVSNQILPVLFDSNGISQIVGLGETAALAAIVIVQRSDGNFFFLQKKFVSGYEYSLNFCFPGGVLRRNHEGSDPFKLLIRETIQGREVNFNNLHSDSINHLIQETDFVIGTQYKVKGEDKFALVKVYQLLLTSNSDSEFQTNTDSTSVQFPSFYPVMNLVSGLSPANAMIAAALFWNDATIEEQNFLGKVLAGANHQTQLTHARLGIDNFPSPF